MSRALERLRRYLAHRGVATLLDNIGDPALRSALMIVKARLAELRDGDR